MGHEGVWGKRKDDDVCKDGGWCFGASWKVENGEKGRRLEYHEKTNFSRRNPVVTTLTLGSRPRKGLVKVWAKSEAQESHSMFLGMCESVREWTSTLTIELPLWELESLWTPESSKSDYRGQNPLDWKVPYIIRKLLKPRCLKWACMTHLGTYTRRKTCIFN